MHLSLVPALVLSLETPFVAPSVLPRIEQMLTEEAERVDYLKVAHEGDVPRDVFASDVDWYLVLAMPETREMVVEFYEEGPNGAPLREWFANEELAQIDEMLCEIFEAG